MVSVDVVLVHFRTPELLARSVASFEQELMELGLRPASTIVVVDNGSDPSDRPLLEAERVELIEPGENLGFAGGVNLGAGRGDGDILVVANPDLVLRGCLGSLIEVLEEGADIAGPSFFWDDEMGWRLPPSERVDRWSVLLSALADRSPGAAARARRRWRRHARRHWSASTPIASFALSGALLALRREAWRRVGPFDDAYRLYFEETDWLERARAGGLRARYVPAARAVHTYARSAARQPLAAEWFEASADRFRDRHYGPLFRSLLTRVGTTAGGSAWSSLEALPEFLDLGALGAPGEVTIEVSSRATGFPAAAYPGAADEVRWRLPEALAQRLGSPYRVTAVDRAGRELGAWARR